MNFRQWMIEVAEIATRQVEVLEEENKSLSKKVDDLKKLLDCFICDDDPCYFDHHGGCQAHGYLSLEPGEKCPHQEAKDILEEE